MQKNIHPLSSAPYFGLFSQLLLFLLLSGCSFLNATDPVEPLPLVEAVPDGWGSQPSGPDALQPWLHDFNDPQLVQLVTEALANNRDLQAAAARLAVSAASLRGVASTQLPKVTAEFSTDNNWRDNSSNDSGPNSGSGSDSSSEHSATHSLGLRMSWEADIWSKIGDQQKAAGLEHRASEADYRAFELSLVANVVKTWFKVVEAVRLEQLAGERLFLAEQTAQVVEESYNRGLKKSAELRLAREQRAMAAGASASAKANRDALVRNLEILLGRYPASLLQPTIADFPEMANGVPTGLPSELLGRRPDLVAARHRLMATEKRLAVTEKQLLPSFKLTGAAGTISDELHNLLDWDYLVIKLTGAIVQLIFDGGKQSADEELGRAKVAQMVADYGSVALNGFREVESALAAQDYYTLRQCSTKEALLELEEAQRAAQERYSHGIGDILSLLSVKKATLGGWENYIKITSGRLQTRVNLYLALGGDFQSNRK